MHRHTNTNSIPSSPPKSEELLVYRELFFLHGVLHVLCSECFLNHVPVFRLLQASGKIRLLDVGSCFNPFLKFEEFLTVGIDIVPAVEVCGFIYRLCF
jgi:hypothetical protein